MRKDHRVDFPSSGRTLTIPQLAQSYPNGMLIRRWAGAWVDFIVLALFLVTPDAVLGNDLYQRTLVIWLGLVCLYFPVTEGFTGRSLGKVVTGTVVVTEGGKIPGVAKASIRTLTRLVEVNPCCLGGIPAGIAVLKSTYHQRLGDMAAKTYVVRARDLNMPVRVGTQPPE
jgi:uncharacterized RDD family membrane protein YckC